MRKRKSNPDWLNFFLIVLAIIAVFVTWGIITKDIQREEKNLEDEKQARLKDLVEEDEKKRLEEELLKVNNRLAKLEPEAEKKSAKMTKVLFVARILIGLALAIANFWFYLFLGYYDISFGDKVSSLLNFDESILLVYSFVALIAHGSPSKFSEALKKRVLRELRKGHLDAVREIKELYLQQEIILKKLSH